MNFNVRGQVPAQGTAATDQNGIVGRARQGGVLSAVRFMPGAAVAFNASNFRTFTLQNRGQAGSGTVVMATLDTSAVSLAAFDEAAMVLSATPANLVVVAGDILAIVETHTGSGVAHGGYLVDCVFTPTYAVN